MMSRRRRPLTWILPFAASAVVLVAVACDETGDTRTDSQTFDADGATSALVKIEMGTGRLNIGGGGSSLAETDFTYNVDDWEPRVDYDVVGDRGELRVRQPSDNDLSILDYDDVEYRWELALSDELPTELDVALGAGKSRMELGGTGVNELNVSTGAGSATIDLTGDWDHDLRGKIESGAGKVTLKLPADVGVRIETDQGIGDIDRSGLDKDGDVYTNAAFGTSDVSIDLEIESGVGEINLEVVE
jgi:hypothetical protein